MRLLLNSLTSNAIFVCGNKKEYLKKRKEAFEALVKIIFLVFNFDKMNIPAFIELIIGTKEREGEAFLGYKNNLKIKEYLTKQFSKIFKNLVKRGKLRKQRGFYLIKDMRWFNEILK
ncbi:hypothetical protein KAJ87_01655 [Candidatus Pacearchaeota archaeon]|nr:hypothetical protein [Candidatus Pacearchaeota archaeon]